MSSTQMMERTGMGMPGVGFPSVGSPTTMPSGMSYLMVPRCTFKVEKCEGGMKIVCSCDDAMACSMVQNLCTMLAGGMCSCYCTCNGVTVCTYNFTMGTCKFEMTPNGVCFTCTTGDAKYCSMVQAYCDCMNAMLSAGCHCCICVNNTPVCWGSSEMGGSKPAKR